MPAVLLQTLRKIARYWTVAITVAVLPVTVLADRVPGEPVVAILIDDIGYDRKRGLKTLDLPRAVTIAVLPHSPFGAELTQLARRQNREILLHQPLNAQSGKRMGPGAIDVSMSAKEMARTLGSNLKWLGGAVGLNNHMGSLFTTRLPATEKFARVLRDSHRDLFVVDSRTTDKTVFESTLIKHRIKAVRRDVFLDHEPTSAFLNQLLNELAARARKHGHALAIGHPLDVTLDALRVRLPELEVRLVPVSHIVKLRTRK